MQDISERTQDGKSGLGKIPILEALDIAPLPICLRNGKPVDIEHASDIEFGAWVRWNGIPVEEDEIIDWSFDDRCMTVNHALQSGLRLRLMGPLPNCLDILSALFVVEEGV